MTCGGPPDLERAQGFADVGAHRYVTAALGMDVASVRRQLETFADTVLTKLS